MQAEYRNSVEACFEWLKNRMTCGELAENGIFERYKIDTEELSSSVRPDCCAEAARALLCYEQLCGSSYSGMKEHLIEWLLRAQVDEKEILPAGTFPFYLVNGKNYDDTLSRYLYANDNGKVLIILLDLYENNHDKRLLEAAERLGSAWIDLQSKEGWFYKEGVPGLQPAHLGPCFSLWLAVGLLLLYKNTNDPLYAVAGRKAASYAVTLMLANGRMQTSYEIEGAEAWRPVSSETAIAALCFGRIFEISRDEEFCNLALRAARYLMSIQHKSGAIMNYDESGFAASEQLAENICDLVYTQGFALQALALLGKYDSTCAAAAKKLSEFLISIQCHDESPLWDGAWRGSYNVVTHEWSGRASQSNEMDEGGMYSIYTGWCNMPIAEGIMRTSLLT